MAGSPAIVQFVGGTPAQAIANTLSMTHITLGRNNAFTLPPLNFTGTPAGIDARRGTFSMRWSRWDFIFWKRLCWQSAG